MPSKDSNTRQQNALKAIRKALSENADTLDLSGQRLEQIPNEVFELKKLKKLELRGNRLTKIPTRLEELQNLESLSLWGNPLKTLPKCIFNLANISRLHLGDMHLGSIPSDIAALKKLRSLWIWENDLRTLPEELLLLPEINVIAAGRNHLADLPPWFGKLPIADLSLFENQFETIPESILSLEHLEYLDLSDNIVSKLPDNIDKLVNLKSLSIGGNPITVLPDTISSLAKLHTLNLDTTNLEEIPISLGNLPNLKVLYIDANPHLRFPPKEILAIDGVLPSIPNNTRPGIQSEQRVRKNRKNRFKTSLEPTVNITATLRYLKECAAAHERVWESKLLIVGEGQVGKTWLFEALRGRLSGGGHPPDTGTVGIEIGELRMPILEGKGEMKLSCWDFAGQSINHATHQFFFSSRALFLLVWSARAGWEAGKLRKWLSNIRDRAPEARIILVSTQIDQPHSDYPEKELLSEFRQIAHAIQVSSTTGVNIDLLKNIIAKEAISLPMMGQVWPSTWRAAFSDIKSLQSKADYCHTHEITKRMHNLGIDEKSGLVLLRWLTELGDILHFPEHASLFDLLVLDPQWVTKRVGEVLADLEVKKCSGVLTDACIDRLWGDLPNYVKAHLIEMMDCFDLAYRIPDDRSNRSIVVERLPENAPDYEPLWESFSNYPELKLRFKLGSMHPGIPTWFIARCHRFSQNMHWVRGVVFGDCRSAPRHLALVVANSVERRVDFAVRGPFPWGFLPLLVDGFLDTVRKRYPGLTVERWVPCPGRRRDSSICDNEVAVDDLENLRFPKDKSESPIELWQCPRCRKSHAIDKLLLGLSSTRPVDTVTLQDIMGAVVESQATIKGEIGRLLLEQQKWIQLELVREWNAAQQAEESSCPTAFSLRSIKESGLMYEDEMYIQLYCMDPECWHSIGADGGCSFRPHKAGLRKAVKALRTCARWIRPLANLLPAAGTVAGETLTNVAEWAKDAKNEMDLTAKVVAELEKLPDIAGDYGNIKEGDATEARNIDLRSLKRFLDNLPFKVKPYGGLRRIRTPEGHILWLCNEHSKKFTMTNYPNRN